MDIKEIKIEGIPFDFAVIVKQLRQDMRDEWFPDSINYEDVLDATSLAVNFGKYRKSKAVKYNGLDSQQYNIPKQGFVLRYALETSLWDRLVYQGLARHLIPYCDRQLNQCVYSHRWSRKPSGKYLFRQPIEAWKDFQNTVKLKLTDATPCLLITDVQNFFENIHIEDVRNCFGAMLDKAGLEAGEKKIANDAVGLLCRLLAKWTPYEKHGIPQNRDASSFVGNIVMHVVDSAMLEKGYAYYRYMDDIRIVCNDGFHARKALKELIVELRKIGLNVNAKKSFIVFKDTPEIEQHLIKPNREIEQIDELWKSKRLSEIRKSLPLLRTLVLGLITQNKTQEREFRFCLNRLENIARCRETRNSFDFTAITDQIISELVNQPYSSDALVRYLKCVDLSEPQISKIGALLADSEKSIYSWQNYHLWQLLVNHGCIKPELVSLAREIVKLKGSDPNTAGAILYLGACGDESYRIFIAKCFKGFKSYLLQRNAMIATHELSYKEYIEPHLKHHVRDDLKGTYKTLSTYFRGTYYRPLDSISAADLYRDIPSYS